MKRLTTGAAFGGLAVYLFDPELGEERRGRLLSLWREKRDTAVQVGQAASQAAESARPLARRMTKAMARRGGAEAFFNRGPVVSLTKLIGAAAVGGALVYFLDPVKGSERRQRLFSVWQKIGHSTLEAGRHAALQTVKDIELHAGHINDQVPEAGEGVKSNVG